MPTHCRGECKRPFTDVTKIGYQLVPARTNRWYWQWRIILHDLKHCPDADRVIIP